jgi:hypothetical protein
MPWAIRKDIKRAAERYKQFSRQPLKKSADAVER